MAWAYNNTTFILTSTGGTEASPDSLLAGLAIVQSADATRAYVNGLGGWLNNVEVRAGAAKQFFYDKQIDEFEQAVRRLTRPSTPRKKKAKAVVAAFEPIMLPSITPPSVRETILQAITAFKSNQIDDIVLQELLFAQAEAIRKRIRRRNEEAAILLLM